MSVPVAIAAVISALMAGQPTAGSSTATIAPRAAASIGRSTLGGVEADEAVAYSLAALEAAMSERASSPAPHVSSSVPPVLRGLAALVQRDLRTARQRLPAGPEWAVFRAMAEMDRPGGFARARSHLATAAAAPSAASPAPARSWASAAFLASLAFFEADQPERAHTLLKRALRTAPSILDETWAPDPAVELARVTLDSVPPNVRVETRRRLAEALVRSGRRGAGRRLLIQDSGPEAASIRWASWEGVDPRRAVDAARRAAPHAPEMALVVAAAELSRGGELDLPAGDLPARHWEARRDRLRAEAALVAGRSADALDAARAAARREPESAVGIAMVVRALLAHHEAGRARAFANVLLARHPLEVNPYRLLIEIDRAEGRLQTLRELELRADGWDDEQIKLRNARARRERVLAAVRDADAGLGVTGLEAVRAEDPSIALPIDLALAKHGPPGTARAARDRILASCSPHLRAWLERRGRWDEVRVVVSPYGRPRTVRVRLSDADPGRCPGELTRLPHSGRR